MACSVVRSSLLRGSTIRHYAAAATAQVSVHATAPECQVLSNKVTVATQDSNSPIAQVSIVFRAGSRNETYDTQGVTHTLRIAAGLSTSCSSGFAITRNIQQLGGNLTAIVDRESIAYTLQITRNNLSEALQFLEHVATKQVFKPWEVSDQLPRMEYELASIPDTTLILELLHKAAFRSGLGYSLFSPKHQLGKIGSETLQHFVSTWFTGPKCAVVGTGVPLSELTALANNLEIGTEDRAVEPSRYGGGELRKESASELTTVAVAVEGVNLKNEKDALACAVLQRACGTGTRVKWGQDVGPLYKQVSSNAGSEPFGLSTFNASYSDSGLFGFILCSSPNTAESLTSAACEWLKSLKLSDSDIARGKAILKAEVLSQADSGFAVLESLQYQALFKGQVSGPASLIANIEKVSASDVKSVGQKLVSGSLSMAAIGDLKTVPYLDQLK
ncbi:PREDICTED: cytochrome b-c1 complex subunit 2, mitochondrial [Dufourea novaeangliae]|uniref:Cytochrome b-c1 complex subunit 2, mitochondrial n=1 Tax=Dufourea novaeangliae TaxID=178035 RepID=A0A154P1A3_DUFNO|nr:PREDICTED: cytochrome b-c1 complex subunit 2, mitochondrial [Dufourea novaeangliae]KZC05705.1 Cytochrome b-c1 complex subunit 2, mitochondrial [Dufourea novaeangliae]